LDGDWTGISRKAVKCRSFGGLYRVNLFEEQDLTGEYKSCILASIIIGQLEELLNLLKKNQKRRRY